MAEQATLSRPETGDATVHTVGIIMNGVTGRMGTNQHLLRSINAIIDQGGIKLSPTEIIMPDPMLVGRNAVKLAALAERAGVEKWTTDLEAALDDEHNIVYFDAQTTDRRVQAVKQAIAARQARLLREAHGAHDRRRRSNSTSWPKTRASSTASCRTSSGCPAC